MAVAKETPLMTQYQAIKSRHRDAILFFRMGDFFEMFHDDAKLAAEELNIVLTARDKDSANPTPMAGVPHHSYRSYAAKLLKKGYKVAICEQTSDPKESKGIVDREVVRVLTPGTLLEEDLLDQGRHNFLSCLARDKESWALVHVDVSTGEALASQAFGGEALPRLCEELIRCRPAEVLLPRDLEAQPEILALLAALHLPEGAVNWVERTSRPSATALAGFFGGKPAPAIGLDPSLEKALGILHAYLARTHGDFFAHFAGLRIQDVASRMQLDSATVRNLELTETQIDRAFEGSLLWVLDRAATSMGSRLVRSWLLNPLCERAALEARYDAVGALVRSLDARRELRTCLKGVYDIPRCLGRLASRAPSPRDVALLRASLLAFPALHRVAAASGLETQAGALLGFDDLTDLLAAGISDSPPLSLAEGGVIRDGYDAELDRLRGLARNAMGWLEEFEVRERERTGIKSLKVRSNKVFGYYIEITKANLSQVPPDYHRKQTLVNGERFVTPELKSKEGEILGAEERARALEAELFAYLRERIAARFRDLQAAGAAAAELDALSTLAEVAEERGYVRPVLVEEPVLRIEDGRHPVVEASGPGGAFVPNSVALEPGSGTSLVLLTGPNMSGKSTYLRQAALIQLMAQMGSYVPAARAELGLVDRLFTRVGASDDLSRGESTFMVEMREAAFILNHVTPRSLVILDEIGRGTATYDGLSIAWAIVEFLSGEAGRGAKVLFATHYHELTALESTHPGITNFSVQVEEEGEDILFLHRVQRGPADKSYGIHVARLAGFPEAVVRRARVLLEDLERGSPQRAAAREPPARSEKKKEEVTQLTLFRVGEDPVVEELRKLDPMNLTPLQAMNELVRLKGLLP